ncbi:MAG: hypothetical protein ACE5G8_14015 [Anaerolineae bacterium]
MNFPDTPLFQFFYWIINTPAIGSIAVALVAGGSILAYGLTLRWISKGADVGERETYAYPTPALHRHHE